MNKFALKSTVIAMSLCGYSTVTFAEDEAPKNKKIEQVTVTGTRIVNALPTERLVVIDAESIAQSGASNINSLLQLMPGNTNSGTSASGVTGTGPKTGGNIEFNDNGASSPNLRGLGANATLVLINGRRPATSASSRGASTDIGSIPVDAIDRIEIFSGGASAIYGADAVGGVINIIMKKDYSGTSASVRYGNSASGGDDFSASLQTGINWDTGNAIVSVRYEEQSAIETSAFYDNNDFRAFGGNNYEGSSQFGLFSGRDVVTGQRPEGTSGALTASELVTGDEITYSNSLPLHLSPEIENYSVYTALTQELGDFAELSVDARFSHRETLFISDIAITDQTLFPGDSGNPYDDFVSYSYQFARETAAGLIPRNSTSSETDQFDIGASLVGDFELFDDHEWSWTATLGYGKEDSDAKFSGLDGEQLFNFGFGALDFNQDNFMDEQSIAFLQSINLDNKQSSRQNDTSENTTFELSMSGTLMELPGGDLSLAIGTEYRKQQFAKPDADLDTRGLRFISSDREVISSFAELNVPVVSRENAIPGVAELTINAAIRHENYKDDVVTAASLNGGPANQENVGIDRSATSPKIGISWRPVADLRVTANWGESFLAPALSLVGLPTQSFVFPTFDPNAPGGAQSVTVKNTFGGNTEVDNENADTFSFGLNYRPAYLDGFELNLDYYKVDYTNRITSLTRDFIFANEEAFPGFVIRDDAGTLIEFIDPTSVNARQETIRGIDIGVSYETELNNGRLRVSADVNRVIEDVRQVSDDLEPESIEGTIDGPIELSGRTQASWSGEQWSFTGAINYQDGYSIAGLSQLIQRESVGSSTTVDFQMTYQLKNSKDLFNNMKINIGATNIFDRDAPFIDRSPGVSTYNYDPRRRVIYLEINKSF